MIISGGVNIYPKETEDLLVMHPKVADVAVFGVPNEEMGEEVKAVVQPADLSEAGPALEAELIAINSASNAGPASLRSAGWTTALTSSPISSFGTPKTATSATLGCITSKSSVSFG